MMGYKYECCAMVFSFKFPLNNLHPRTYWALLRTSKTQFLDWSQKFKVVEQNCHRCYIDDIVLHINSSSNSS